jgi:nucleotide sugar dehydrogenase
VTENRLALAINGRERLLEERLVPLSPNGASSSAPLGSVAVVGLGYVGLPTALALLDRAARITGVDVDEQRLAAIRDGEVDLSDADRLLLAAAVNDETFRLTTQSPVLAAADAVIICVPTPVDGEHAPNLSALRAACDTVVHCARPGQTIILTSTSYVGTTRQLLIEPLEQLGFRVGVDVHVAFSPERIDPGNPDHVQRETPRVVGGATVPCSERAGGVIGQLTDSVYLVTSPEAAELSKLYENIFRAVTLALANEFADVCGTLGLDPIEVTLAAGTKPYGFLGAFPGPGVGGHCIPCDPYYLLWQLGAQDRGAPLTPLISQTMRSIAQRPLRVVERAAEVLAEDGHAVAGARVLLVGVSYKAGVQDLRESPALSIIRGLRERGAAVHYHDPLMPVIRDAEGRLMHSVAAPADPIGIGAAHPGAGNGATTAGPGAVPPLTGGGADRAGWDLAIIHVVHSGSDLTWVWDVPRVLDATYQFDGAPRRSVV